LGTAKRQTICPKKEVLHYKPKDQATTDSYNTMIQWLWTWRISRPISANTWLLVLHVFCVATFVIISTERDQKVRYN